MPPIVLTQEDDDIDVVGGVDAAPMSRTHKYRKFMKPLLERKRRARINSYLDELKDLMVSALQAEGETITKLEKADVLELTLRHLQKLRRQQLLQTANPAMDVDRYRAGYSACASEVGRYMSTADPAFGSQLLSHLGSRCSEIEQQFVHVSTSNRASPPVEDTHPHFSSRTSLSSAGLVSPASTAATKEGSEDTGYTSSEDASRDDNSPSPPPLSSSSVAKHSSYPIMPKPLVVPAGDDQKVWRPF